MDYKSFLENTQPIVYKTFSNARVNKKVAQQYLIKGAQGTPTLETALFLAKSLLCEKEDTFACSTCPTCKRFENGNYADFILLDAKSNVLKVADIEMLESRFSSSSLEKNGKMIYIIHHVENMNRESINALLKFLEEPSDNIYAFLTTENEEKVLPTILSRCQHLKLLPVAKDDLVKVAKDEGISLDDAEILSCFSSEISSLNKTLSSEAYEICKEVFIDYLDALSSSLKKGYYYIQKEGITKIKSKEQIRLFIDMLSVAFKDMLNVELGLASSLPSINKLLNSISKKINDKEMCYKEIMFTRGRIELNVTVSLILEHIALTICKGGNL